MTNPGACDTGTICNLLNSPSITDFLLAIIRVLLIFALPIIIFFIIYAGFLFVTARGDTGQIQTAKSALMWAIIGGVIVLGAELIIDVIKGTIILF